jgi:hypothetical protein
VADPPSLGRRARRAAAAGPNDLVGRAAEKVGRVVSRRRSRRRDHVESTFLADEATPGPLRPRVALPSLSSLEPHASGLRRLTRLYLAHRFNVLGSGWVEVRHGVACDGLEGLRYPSGPAVRADADGDWLAGRLPTESLAEAQRIWRLIEPGYEPIDWQLDVKSGWRWSELTWSRDVKYGDVLGADVKVPWELARMQHLPQLALAAFIATSGRDGFEAPARYAQAFRGQVLDFIATNPPRFGVNWSMTMDVAIRVVNWLAAYDLFRSGGVTFDVSFEAIFRRSILEHGRHLVDNLEWHPTARGNHYLADVAGLLFVAAHLGRDRERDAWFAFATGAVIAEATRQLQADGSGFEASTCYHRLTAEIVAYSAALLSGVRDDDVAAVTGADMRLLRLARRIVESMPAIEISGLDAGNGVEVGGLFPGGAMERLGTAAEFTIDLTKPSGAVVQIGDNDSGRFLKLLPAIVDERPLPAEDHLDHRHLVAAVNGLLDRSDLAHFSGPWAAEAEIVRSLAGRTTATTTAGSGVWRARTVTIASRSEAIEADNWWERQPERSRWSLTIPIDGARAREGLRQLAYPDFGVYIFRSNRVFLSIRCGSVGQKGIGGHAHNDQLAIELAVDGIDWIRDPGSYVYTALPARRNEYRSVRSHFAPAPGEDEPASLGDGLFELGPGTDAQCEYWGPDGFVGRARFSGSREVTARVALRDDLIAVDYVFRGCDPDPRLSTAADWRALLPTVRFSPGYGELEDRG